MFFKIIIIQPRWSIYTIWSDLDNLSNILLALNEPDLTLIYRFRELDLYWKIMASVSSPYGIMTFKGCVDSFVLSMEMLSYISAGI